MTINTTAREDVFARGERVGVGRDEGVQFAIVDGEADVAVGLRHDE
mgnify:CR=1 FL=1